MQVMGVTFNRPDFSGAAANQKQHNNMLQQINAIKRQNPNPNPNPNASLSPLSNLAQIPAFGNPNAGEAEVVPEEDSNKLA